MQKEEIIERHLREHGLEMKDINNIIPFMNVTKKFVIKD